MYAANKFEREDVVNTGRFKTWALMKTILLTRKSVCWRR